MEQILELIKSMQEEMKTYEAKMDAESYPSGNESHPSKN
jgi:hypothetical protein